MRLYERVGEWHFESNRRPLLNHLERAKYARADPEHRMVPADALGHPGLGETEAARACKDRPAESTIVRRRLSIHDYVHRLIMCDPYSSRRRFDMPTSLRFYRDVLGFSVVSDVPGDDQCDWVILERP